MINSRGIKLNNTDEVSWGDIFNDEVYNESNGKSSTNYLSFNDEKISILVGVTVDYVKQLREELIG